MVINRVEHICNSNLETAGKDGIKMRNPKTGMVHVVKTYLDVIEFNEASMVTKEEVKKDYGETEDQKKKREAENKANIDRIQLKLDRKAYGKLTENIKGFRNNNDMIGRIERAEARFIFTFGYGFITVMFLGFISGYMLGRAVLGWDQLASVILSLVVGIPTIMVEMLLMMCRLHKWDKMKKMEKERLNLD